MNKLICMILVCALMLVCASAEDAEAVRVFISMGSEVLCAAEVSGAENIDDALRLAHAACYESGEEGYMSYVGEWGISMSRLWGIENGGAYGYNVNGAPAMSLADCVRPGDTVCAFIYTDTDSWSDTPSFFDISAVSVNAGEEFALTLNIQGYDESWTVVTMPLAGARVTLDGAETGEVTDENGLITLSISKEGTYILSALSDEINLIAPVCVITVK